MLKNETFLHILSKKIKDKKMLEKYNNFLEKVSSIIKNEFDSKHVLNEKYLKTKRKSYYGKNQHKIPKEGSQLICLF